MVTGISTDNSISSSNSEKTVKNLSDYSFEDFLEKSQEKYVWSWSTEKTYNNKLQEYMTIVGCGNLEELNRMDSLGFKKRDEVMNKAIEDCFNIYGGMMDVLVQSGQGNMGKLTKEDFKEILSNFSTYDLLSFTDRFAKFGNNSISHEAKAITDMQAFKSLILDKMGRLQQLPDDIMEKLKAFSGEFLDAFDIMVKQAKEKDKEEREQAIKNNIQSVEQRASEKEKVDFEKYNSSLISKYVD